MTQPGWETFTGDFGSYEFKDGVSVEALTQRTIDRLAAATALEIVEESGDKDAEGRQAGPAARIIGGVTLAADVVAPLPRADKEVFDEQVATLEAALTPKHEILTRQVLEEIADKSGISGLRKVAEPWGAKGRAILEVINAILRKQDEFVAFAREKLEKQNDAVKAALAARKTGDEDAAGAAREIAATPKVETDAFVINDKGESVQVDGRIVAQANAQFAKEQAEEIALADASAKAAGEAAAQLAPSQPVNPEPQE